MSTEPLLEKSTKLETSLENVISAPVRIKSAIKVARCHECDASQKTLTRYFFITTNDELLLCSGCAINYGDTIKRPEKLSKKERRRSRKL
jgi:hypothetical protein